MSLLFHYNNFQDAYADPATCFLTCKNNMIWSFAGPVVFVLGVSAKRFILSQALTALIDDLKLTLMVLLKVFIINDVKCYTILENLYQKNLSATWPGGTTHR